MAESEFPAPDDIDQRARDALSETLYSYVAAQFEPRKAGEPDLFGPHFIAKIAGLLRVDVAAVYGLFHAMVRERMEKKTQHRRKCYNSLTMSGSQSHGRRKKIGRKSASTLRERALGGLPIVDLEDETGSSADSIGFTAIAIAKLQEEKERLAAHVGTNQNDQDGLEALARVVFCERTLLSQQRVEMRLGAQSLSLLPAIAKADRQLDWLSGRIPAERKNADWPIPLVKIPAFINRLLADTE